ncbi:MAG: hypothetical protein AAGJ79_12685 [Verrucomicrobiota bacterium]
MKSAYELAMERLNEDSPVTPLTDEQKAEIAAIDDKFKAKIAEREVFLKGEIAKAQAAMNFQEIADFEAQLASDLKRLQDNCESEKEKIRGGA